MKTKTKKHTPGPAFALAGEIVHTHRHALRILVAAQLDGRHWLVPQARNVAAILHRAAIAKATDAA